VIQITVSSSTTLMELPEEPWTLSTDISTDNKGDTASISRPFNTILDDFQ